MNALTRKLAAKELYVHRGLVLGGTVSGLLSVLLAGFGRLGFNIGSLTWLTTIIALGVMLAMYGILTERKENSLVFVLSLPLSAGDYVRAKLAGLGLCFFIPWLASSAAAVLLVLVNAGIPDGLLPFVVLLCGFMLANFALVLCGTLHARTEAVVSALIIVTNAGVSIFMFVVGGLPGLKAHLFGAVPVWNATFWTILAAELSVLALAFTLPLLFAARRRDFI
jgi:ABC-2 type transport system permease protein